MKGKTLNLEESQKELVLFRFRSLNPESKITLGGEGEISVRKVIDHIEKGDDFGKKVIRVQMNMLKVLSSGVNYG